MVKAQGAVHRSRGVLVDSETVNYKLRVKSYGSANTPLKLMLNALSSVSSLEEKCMVFPSGEGK